LFWSAVQPGAVAAGSLIPGTFEEGQGGPRGWHRRGEGTWADAGAHRGNRCVRGRSPVGEVAWESQTVAVEPATDYRLEGWLKAASGEARLSLELLDASGRALGRAAAPALRQVGDWRYVAVECPSGAAVAARVLFWVRGEADLDDVALSAVATSYIGNKSVEDDDRGRVGFWGEEKNDTLVPGRRAGRGRPDASVRRTGKTSLELTATGDWYAWSSVPYALPAWTDRVRLSGWVRCDGPAKAQLLACWVDDAQKVLRVDAAEAPGNGDWREVVLLPDDPPAGAAAVRVVAVARGGRVWFDDFELLRLRPRKPVVRVFVNQVGYEQDGPKTAVVATNFFPSGGTTITFQLLTPEGQAASQVQVPCSGRIHGGTPDDWGWYFWRADFTPWRTAGTYRAAAVAAAENDAPVARGTSPAFKVGRDVVLAETAQRAVDFFFIQRCGFDVPGWHKACHLDDAKLPDGTHVDATGGWHSAGDYNKLMYEHGDGGVVFALLAAYRANPRAFERHNRNRDGLPDVLDEARWGADFMAKMQIPETGGLRNHVHQGPGRSWTRWSAPDVHTDNVIGTADDPVITAGEGSSPLLIGGWARLSVLQAERGIKTDYLLRAERLWDHATKRGTQVASPHLLLSALEMHRATGRPAYLDAARRAAEALLAQQTTTGRARGAFGTFGALPAAALAQLALDHPGDGLGAKIREAIKLYITFCASTADNPFGFSRQPLQDGDYFFPPGMTLGNNFEVLGRAWAAALIYRLTGDPRALAYAADQMDWVLGKNPEALCMFEGKGERNPPRYHHRYNMIPGHERGAVPGCVPNGFVRDMGLADRPGFDLSRGGNRSPSFRTSEPWLVHNLFYLLAAGALDQASTRVPDGR
jgi:hypothetical protein